MDRPRTFPCRHAWGTQGDSLDRRGGHIEILEPQCEMRGYWAHGESGRWGTPAVGCLQPTLPSAAQSSGNGERAPVKQARGEPGAGQTADNARAAGVECGGGGGRNRPFGVLGGRMGMGLRCRSRDLHIRDPRRGVLRRCGREGAERGDELGSRPPVVVRRVGPPPAPESKAQARGGSQGFICFECDQSILILELSPWVKGVGPIT